MAWYLLARALFVLAVTYAAVLTRPLSPDVAPNVAFGVALGLVMLVVEVRLRSAEVTDLLGALIGGAIGLGLAKTIGAALFWANTGDPASSSSTASSCWCSPISGSSWARARGSGWSRRARGAVPRRRAAEAVPHPRHQRHHRRPHRRHLRDRAFSTGRWSSRSSC
jgi:hypothetical protein